MPRPVEAVPQSKAWAQERRLGVWVRLNHAVTGLAITLAVESSQFLEAAALSVAVLVAYAVYLAWLRAQPPTRDVAVVSFAVSVMELVYINVLFWVTNASGLAGETWRSGPAILLMVAEVMFAARFVALRHIALASLIAFSSAYLRAYLVVKGTFIQPNQQFLAIIQDPEVWAVVLETWTMVPILFFIAREYFITRYMAETDGLTNLLNHRSFYDTLEYLLRQADRAGGFVSLALVDIDYFKALNDRHGHRYGDAVLQTVASILQQGVRSTDGVFRYGGEEFGIILPNTPPEEALRIAERLRAQVEQHPFPVPDDRTPVRITISAGVATYPVHAKEVEALVEAADKALYKAKRSARNCVWVCGHDGNGWTEEAAGLHGRSAL